MATFPTPPSSNDDALIYYVASPTSNSFSVASPLNDHLYLSSSNSSSSYPDYSDVKIISGDVNMSDIDTEEIRGAPYLKFLEQPTNKFRFRYKSEMAGTHGSLSGMNSDKSRKQTYPTVQLVNFPEKAIVRCSIYQYKVTEDFKPHPHRLVMKRGRDEYDDPHDLPVGPEEGFIATFHSMGIIHTARKNIVHELVRKKTQLRRERFATLEGKTKQLNLKELQEIKGLAEQESKSINLNIVCLRFDAFFVKNGILNPICRPIFSHGINNLKCALTGDLKIVRMDHCTSPASGNLEIFMLVERVTKRNIKVRFFELDDDGEEVWAADGRFTELDVHHQYAIVFRTPPYKDVNITSRIKVFIELVRPSDNARSEPRDFTYKPCDYPGAKRPRTSVDQSSSSSFSNSSYNSNELPTTLSTATQAGPNVYPLPSASSWNPSELIPDEQLQRAMDDYSSDEFGQLFEDFAAFIPDVPVNSVDCSRTGNLDQKEFCGKLNELHIDKKPRRKSSGGLSTRQQPPEETKRTLVKSEVTHDDWAKALRTYDELKSLVKTEDAQKKAPEVLAHYLDDRERRNNALHVFIGQNCKDEVTFLLKMLVLSKKTDLANVPNADSDTPLHIAVLNRNDEFLSYLLVGTKANPLIQNANGQTVLHYAIKTMANIKVFELLMAHKNSDELVDMEDNDGNFPLSYAVEKRNMTALKILCRRGVQINKQHKKSGFTALRFAVENDYVEAVQLILEQPDLEWEVQFDFQGVSPYRAAMAKQCNPALINALQTYLTSNDINPVVKVEMEGDDDGEDNDEVMIIDEVDYKQDVADVVELYANVKHLTETCLDEVAAILDDSGKYQDLADLLDMDHLLHSGVISTDRSISRNLLLYATENENVSILELRNFLENLDEHGAVAVLDKMARSS